MNKIHSPLHVMMMLHYYCMVHDYPAIDAPAQRECLRYFIHHEMLRATVNDDKAYECTEKGVAFVDALCSVKLPVATWTIPARDT